MPREPQKQVVYIVKYSSQIMAVLDSQELAEELIAHCQACPDVWHLAFEVIAKNVQSDLSFLN